MNCRARKAADEASSLKTPKPSCEFAVSLFQFFEDVASELFVTEKTFSNPAARDNR